MKNIIQILMVVCLAVTCISCSGPKPYDIRNAYLKKGLTEADYAQGKALIKEMEEAYGGHANWLAHEKGSFIQEADWYGRKAISGWDTVPQRYEMFTSFKQEAYEITLLNGENKGRQWGFMGGKMFTREVGQNRVLEENQHYKEKMIFKSYWFQFPFRISEAEIISYAGQEEVKGKLYDVVYATWGSEEANKEFDQFLLYLDPETHYLIYLHFTVRDKFEIMSFSARFDNFKQVDDLILPHSQFVRKGSPQKEGIKMHENHYLKIWF